MSKSERPRLHFSQNHSRLEIEFVKLSPMLVAEPVSIFFAQVKDVCTWKPWLILFVSCASIASYSASPPHQIPRRLPILGLITCPLPIGVGQRYPWGVSVGSTKFTSSARFSMCTPRLPTYPTISEVLCVI